MLLYTAHETLLDPLIARPLADGELLANANTLILMGKIQKGSKLTRGLLVAKHRGSPPAMKSPRSRSPTLAWRSRTERSAALGNPSETNCSRKTNELIMVSKL